MLEKSIFSLVEEENGFLKISKKLENQIIRRQDAPKVFEHVASIYAYLQISLEKEVVYCQEKR